MSPRIDINPMKDRELKKTVKEIIENCHLDDLVVDREVSLNLTGSRTTAGKYIPEKEIDVIAKFSYGGKRVLLLFECEDSQSASGVTALYSGYDADIRKLAHNLTSLHVLGSGDGALKSGDFVDVDPDTIRACFVYGNRFPEASYQHCCREARHYGFVVLNYLALTYYHKISAILGSWTKFELFKEFSLKLESTGTFTIDAVKAKQKGKTMYLARIHPGQLLKIGYVLRRASEKTYAYQRMLNKDRIDAIGKFITSTDPQSFLPNAVIAVLDNERAIKEKVHFDADKKQLTLPLAYCSAWLIDGQHRVYGFLGTRYEHWTHERFEPFDLPIVLFRDLLPEEVQTQTFVNINYYQKKIKTELLCDLTTVTKDMHNRLTWPSLIGHELNRVHNSPLRNQIRISELHTGRPIKLGSLVPYGLLETLLGYKPKSGNYAGPLFDYENFDPNLPFDSSGNQHAFSRQVDLLVRFLNGVKRNTSTPRPGTDPWRNHRRFALLKPTGLNALFMLLAKILREHPTAALDFDLFLKPLKSVSFKRQYVSEMGGGWKGFRRFANLMISRLNKGTARKRKLGRYGKKEKT